MEEWRGNMELGREEDDTQPLGGWAGQRHEVEEKQASGNTGWEDTYRAFYRKW